MLKTIENDFGANKIDIDLIKGASNVTLIDFEESNRTIYNEIGSYKTEGVSLKEFNICANNNAAMIYGNNGNVWLAIRKGAMFELACEFTTTGDSECDLNICFDAMYIRN